jgi:SnoaL-like protein
LSAEDVEIVRRLYESFRSRDNDAAYGLLDPEIEWDAREIGRQERGAVGDMVEVYRGHDGVRRFWRTWLDAWSEIEFDVEIEDLGYGRLIGHITNQRLLGRGSGIWVDQQPYGQIWTIRDGKAVRMEYLIESTTAKPAE